MRLNSNLRDLLAEVRLSTNDLIQPLFIKEGLSGKEAIESMPNINRYGQDSIFAEIEELLEHDINTIALFPVINDSKKNSTGDEAINASNLMCETISNIKKRFPEIILISDVALDPYTDHGHDGILKNDYVDNDETLAVLRKQSLTLAQAGTDIIAPSDMMDGRIGAIREALDEMDYKNTILLSYAAKYNSKFYGPFRDAVNSASSLGKSSKASYQMSPKNINEALHEVAMDINEGADIIMVKPGMPYLDIIKSVKEKFKIPVFAYQVSGEYSLISNAVQKKLVNKDAVVESLMAFKRAGASAIVSYYADRINKILK